MNKVCKVDFNELNDFISRHNKSVSIVEGDTFSLLKSELLRLCSYQKALFITLKSSGEKLKEFISSLSENNVNVVTLEIDEATLSVDSVSILFTAPEDVRAIVCFDYELFDYALYFSSIKNVKLILAPSRVNLISAIKPIVMIRNGEKTDCVSVNPDTTIIFDRKKISALSLEVSKAYESVVSLTLALIEYRILRLIKEKNTYRESYEIIKNSITETFDIISYEKTFRGEVLAYKSLYISIANYAVNGEILFGTTYSACERLGVIDSVLEISNKVLRLSKYAFTEMKSTKKIPDYISRAKVLGEKLGTSTAFMLEDFLASAKLYLKSQNQIKKFFATNALEIDGLINSFFTAKKISNNLPKAKTPKISSKYINETIKYLGDLGKTVNLCTFLREKGALELI